MRKYVGMSSDKRLFRVDAKNLHIIPKGWKVFKSANYRYYNVSTKKILELYSSLKELKTPEDVERFKAINAHNIDVLFGYFSKLQELEY
jgi:hypothetical protein